MKKEYSVPELELVHYRMSDVLVTSPPYSNVDPEKPTTLYGPGVDEEF